MKTGIALLGLMAGTAPIALGAQTQAGAQTAPVTPAQTVQAPATPAASTPPAPTTAQAATAQHTAAQQVPDPYDSGETVDITVVGQRERGAVAGDIKPEEQLRPADIRAYGVSSVADLLAELAPLTNSGRGRGGEAPVVLLNGKRISGMNEIRDLPTEAIERVDILPEEVALKYGYPANSKVVNFVLRRRFRAITTEGTGTAATEGGRQTGRAELDMLRIRNDSRFTLGVDYNQSGALTEGERGVAARATSRPYDFTGNVTAIANGAIVDPRVAGATVLGAPAAAATGAVPIGAFATTANTSDIGDWRTLSPRTQSLSVNSVFAHPLSSKISATVNATLDTSNSESLRGPATANLLLPAGNPYSPFAADTNVYRYIGNQNPLTQSSTSTSGHLGATVNGEFSTAWRWNVTGQYDRGYSRTISTTGVDTSQVQALLNARSASLNPFGPIDPALLPGRAADRARSTTNSGDLSFVTSGPLARLPAGTANATVKVGGAFNGLDGYSVRTGIAQSTDLTRRQGSGQVSVDLPLTSRKEDVLAAIGNLSANINASIDRYSDFGTLSAYGAGLRYSPRDRIDFIGSYTHEQGVPTIQQLGNPQVLTANVPYYDATLGRQVTISQISGGNPNLLHDTREVWKLGLTVKPFEKTDLTFTVNYNNSRTRNGVSQLPLALAEAESAFPDRFTRDATGTLTRVDARSINLASQDRQQLRWGFNFSKPLKSNTQALIAAFRAAYPNGMPGFQRPPGESVPGAPGGQRPEGAPPMGQGQQAGGQPSGGQAAGNTGERPAGAGPGGGGGGGGQRGPGGPGGRFGGGPGGGGGRLQLGIFHTWIIEDQIRIRDGLPVIDLLNGGATGTSGGTSRHQFDLQAGYNNNGIGMRLTGTYKTGTTVTTGLGTSGGTGNLRFSGLTTANFRLFVNPMQMPSMVKYPWVRGMRVSFNVTNIFNQRPKVRDATGATPLSYQPAYLDPLGRTVSISVRKLFFGS
ncbi:TonB-dependent receptor [Sphingomonas naphthae]|uniref:TonB-dependent receptor n=1 Tax=Sphingomonas naphthae TaxID=1813468 RepID=A0ABY7TKV1_9SPHN|nr:TonB-dependent receptor [Sphingomonas naphthae]WCT73596.1 TonB-dependent receptor [Sphingomonas naphthae]